MKRLLLVGLTMVVVLGLSATPAAAQTADMNTLPHPIDAVENVWIEELTVTEVRDAIRGGKTTVIVAAGAMEQNGPFLVIGKHNYVLESTAPAIAMKLGNALVAPVVRFSPSGDINPPTGHMEFAGTISLTQQTYEAVLTDIVSSLAQHGFTDIVLIGESGGGEQTGMDAVSQRLNALWKGRSYRVHYIPEYYEEDKHACRYLAKELGIVETSGNCAPGTPSSYHTNYNYEAMVATTNPERIRTAQRIKADLFQLNGVDLVSIKETLANGWKVVDYRATIVARAIRKAISDWK